MFSPCLTGQKVTDFGVDKNPIDKLQPLEVKQMLRISRVLIRKDALLRLTIFKIRALIFY
ncbi:MAG: hypothetical protein EBS24_08945 [Chitinophagia bacterium]|nr:hypothetical protein [Chitinophagia bacterium]